MKFIRNFIIYLNMIVCACLLSPTSYAMYTDLGGEFLAPALMDAAREGDLKKIEELVKKGARKDEKDQDGRTALHVAIESGHMKVVQFFTSPYYEGLVALSEEKYDLAIVCFTDAARQGNSRALFQILQLYGKNKVQSDFFSSEIVELFQRGAAKGDAVAQFNLGYMHQESLGVERNYSEARRLFGLAAAQGNASAQMTLQKLDKLTILNKAVVIEEKDNCAICLDQFIGRTKTVTVLPCTHKYHASCIKKWAREKGNESVVVCPTCRAEIELE